MKRKIHVLYSDGCPHAAPTVDLVHEIAKELGISIDLSTMLIETPEHAKTHKYIGSPTVQVDGIDIDPSARNIQSTGFS
jgi:hypothetical protein